MSSNNSSSKVVTVDEQAFEQASEQTVNEGRFPVVDETPAFEATVEQETQAKVDANHPEGIADTSGDRIHGATLAQEERIQAREDELERISDQAEFGQQDGRAWRTRQKVDEMRCDERTGTRVDPRAKLERETLAEVNQFAQRLADDVDSSYTRAVIAKRIASRVLGGAELFEAVMETKEELLNEAGTIVPIGRLEEIDRGEVSVEGRIIELWEPACPSQQQVGLIEDETGRTKFTVWTASEQTKVREGDQVRFRAAAKNWYNGRCSIALTRWSEVRFPDRDPWWE
ncbi:DNA-binding protein [Natrinema thermotolerans]|uniref:DNA-binding protein n=1 Tax=Natrinema thermotolerans TaxID=121872 RepID=A0AAF0T177_9EURY|nr:DNA-binding protein [Natrinema thermotolerans]QCC61696.1 DNA-binding protein [Natrinema thermotolerans]WMT07875.1 DNA-binding protein [Natrinema thermotolerans]